jgi:hypothetical protein
MQDPSNIPPAIAAHGAMGSDTLVPDFAQASATWESIISMDHGTYIDCNDGGNHLDFFTTRAPNLKPVCPQVLQRPPVQDQARAVHLPSERVPHLLRLNAAGTLPEKSRQASLWGAYETVMETKRGQQELG